MAGRQKGRYNYIEEQTDIAKSLGYDSVDCAMVAMYNKGFSCKSISVEFDLLTHDSINRRLKALGVKMRSKGGDNRSGISKQPSSKFKISA